MKKACVMILFALAGIQLFSQVNLSGSYGYTTPPPANTGNDKNAKGGAGNLVLIKMEGNKYRFWLDVNIGWPTYNTGETDGTVTFKNDTASFDNTHEDSPTPCVLYFKIMNNTIHIKSKSASYNCGFGDGVKAEGNYAKLDPQPALDNDWLKKEYYDAPTIIITAEKAELFQDETFLYPFSKKQYLNKDNKYLAVAETDNGYYVEQINPNGSFIYGWIRKSTAKVSAGN